MHWAAETAARGARLAFEEARARFWTNAATPSTKSPEPAISCWIDASSSSCSSMPAKTQALSWRFVPA